MVTNYLLGIDVGTSSVKATMIDDCAAVVATACAAYDLLPAPPEYRQLNTASLLAAVLLAVSELGHQADLSQVRAIGLSCLCPGLAAFDEAGHVLVDPIIYSDQRSVIQAEEIRQAMDNQELFSHTANLPMPGAMSSTSMLWIKENLPSVYQRTFCFGHINTLMGVYLTGQFAIDPSNASYTLLFDTTGTRDWSDLLCEKIGIPRDKLPPLLRSTDIVGLLNAPDMIALGLPAGTPVIIGGGDTACASLATGVVRGGDVCESMGTTDVLTVCTQTPVFRKEFINRCHVVEGCWIYQGAMSHTGSSLNWCREQLCPDMVQGGGDPFDHLTQQADCQSCPGANGVVFLPYMMGERSPVWDPYARGIFFGLSLNTTRADMIRAVLEASGYGILQMMKLAEETTGKKITSFSAVGGASKSNLWTQIKADITGADITVLKVKDMAPIGAALLAGVGIGLFPDVYDASSRVQRNPYRTFHSCPGQAGDIYARRFQTYLALYPCVKSLFRPL